MAGTLLNTALVLLGSTLGLFLGNRLSARIQESVVTGLALIVFVIGLENASRSQNIIVPLLSVALGIVIGEWLDLDAALKRLAAALQARISSEDGVDTANARARFINGFVTATLVFCVGPLTIVGSIQDGMGLASGFDFLLIKSVLDFFTSMAFAASFGVGVIFSALGVLSIQGLFALLGFLLVSIMEPSASSDFATNPMILELTAVGGVLLLGLALAMMEIKAVRVANYLPALIIAPLLVWLAGLLGIGL